MARPACVAIPPHLLFLITQIILTNEPQIINIFNFLRVESRSRILDLLDQTGHVLEEEVVQVLLLHVLQLEDGFVLGGHGDDV